MSAAVRPDWFHPADLDAMKRLLDAAAGLVRIVTLPPEYDTGLAVTRWLAGQKIVVSAGHCNPDLIQVKKGDRFSLSMLTASPGYPLSRCSCTATTTSSSGCWGLPTNFQYVSSATVFTSPTLR